MSKEYDINKLVGFYNEVNGTKISANDLWSHKESSSQNRKGYSMRKIKTPEEKAASATEVATKYFNFYQRTGSAYDMHSSILNDLRLK